MSSGKHTPGPWFVYPNSHERFVVGDYNGGQGPCRVIADCAPRECITGAGDRTKSEAESEANAKLIASAPDLLAERDKLLALNAELVVALEKCRAALEPYDDEKPRDWKTDRQKLAQAHKAACTAIKAAGEAL